MANIYETMADLFDRARSQAEKDDGMALAAMNRRALLAHARGIAVNAARGRVTREATADDVSRILGTDGMRRLGNAAGSLFRGKAWEFTGRWEKSRRITNHARDIKVWRLK